MADMKFTQSEPPTHIKLNVIWAIAFMVALVGLLLNEVLLRAAHHPSTVVSDADLWSLERSRVNKLSGNDMVLLGASRMQTNIDTQYIRENCNDLSVVQLAMSGKGSPLPAFRDLVRNSEFSGLVLISETESTMKSGHSTQNEFIRAYQTGFPLESKLDRLLRNAVEPHFRSITPYGSSYRLYGNILFQRQLPHPYHVTTLIDRSQVTNFDLMNSEILEEIRDASEREAREAEQVEVENGEDWKIEIKQNYSELIEVFRNRGGTVVFIRMPVDELRWSLEERRFPTSLFWSQLPKFLGVESIHFTEIEDWQKFELGDRSHLSAHERKRFTRELLLQIRQRLDNRINQVSRCQLL